MALPDRDDSKNNEFDDPKKPVFYIDLRPKLVHLPDIEDKRKINVRYPLIPPHTFAHIFWDEKNMELIYYIEEPILTETEKEVLKLVQMGLEEMINISLVKANKFNLVLDYLEKNVQSILIELGTKVSAKTYQKIMYYVYRDSVGLNDVEPLLHDYYIEDIECNGNNFPVYIVHRKYDNLKTNLIYNNPLVLIDFVEKLAQKTGRYVSYAKPLLDGTLEDGSRVNAVYTQDVTTRGPTFTIRKFTKEPLTPINLMKLGTGNPAFFAYVWLCVEHKFNIIVVGETASGKTTLLNGISFFVPPEARICSIEDTREINLVHENWLPSVSRDGFGIPDIRGHKYGEVTLFDLLKESFRQNPDYVIVGEVRGPETFVLFQGMGSGHPSFATFHASSVETLVRRLETPPINLSSSLVESLNICISVTHVKEQKKNYRRIRQVDEVISVGKNKPGEVDANVPFQWDAEHDKMEFSGRSYIFELMSKRIGQPIANLYDELEVRTKLLQRLYDDKPITYREFSKLMNSYNKDPELVLKHYDIKLDKKPLVLKAEDKPILKPIEPLPIIRKLKKKSKAKKTKKKSIAKKIKKKPIAKKIKKKAKIKKRSKKR